VTAKKFSNNQEFYTYIQELIKKLRENRNTYWSIQIENALRGGFTSGEILGGVRLELINFQKTEIPEKINLKQEIETVIKTLDDALGYWRP
jgi:hypothetical protein